MQIFDEILEQYIQTAIEFKQYKQNLENVSYYNSIDVDDINLSNLSETTQSIVELQPKLSNVNHNSEKIDIRNFYDQLEFDSRRYNRNFDSQIGAEIL